MFPKRFVAAAALVLAAALPPAHAAVSSTPVVLAAEFGSESRVVPFGTGFFAVWKETTPSQHANLRGQRFTATGKPIGAAFYIDDGGDVPQNMGRPVIVPVDATTVAVFYHGTGFAGQVYLQASLVKPIARTASKPAEILTLAEPEYFMAATRGPDGVFTVAYTQLNVFVVPAQEVVRTLRLAPNFGILAGSEPLNGDGDDRDGITNVDYAVVSRQGGTLALHTRRYTSGKVAILAKALDAKGKAVGKNYAINTTPLATRNTFFYANAEIRAARLKNGRILVTWASFEGTDPFGFDGWEVRARLLSPTGAPIGSDFRVNGVKAGMQSSPEILALAGGRFAVAWVTSGVNGAYDYQIRTYDAAGKPLGTPKSIFAGNNPHMSADMAVAQLTDGSVVAVFEGDGVVKAVGLRSLGN